MEHLGPHRKFIDPHNVDGIGKVLKRTPIPRRAVPLDGVRKLLVPADQGSTENWRSARGDEPVRPRLVAALGWAAVLCVVALLAYPWLSDTPGNLREGTRFLWVIGSLAGAHGFAVFAQIQSRGRSVIGGWIILGLYAGVIVNLLLRHWLA